MKEYNVKDFGARADGKTDDSAAIQKAIDCCFENGGGRVLLDGGIFFSSSVIIRKNVELTIQKGAVLKATDKIENYFRPCETINDPKTALVGNPVTGKPSFAFIYGFEADGASISGGGEIDANCYAFVERKSEYYVTGNFYPRPTVIYIEKSNHITVRDVTIKNAPFWTLHPAGCDDVLISKIRILNPLDVANSDGIDPDHCTNVRIEGCHIECADDCICLKNSKGNSEYGECKNIIITGCTLISTSAAIKIGTEGINNFKNILVDNCIISKSNRGLSIQVRDCGNVENVSYSNIIIETRRFCSDWWGTAEPISITSLRRDENTKCGSVKNIRFCNITCKGENGVLLFSGEDNPIENVHFEKVNVTLSKSTKWPCAMYDLRPCIDFSVEQQKNACFFIRNADGVSFDNCEAAIEPDEAYSCAVDAENANGITFEKFRFGNMESIEAIKIK
ncbi:MAG: glycoside hydrolase family 28 protein [Acutalibacteraceae bacterium]